MIRYDVATATDTGKVREGNEDFVRYLELDRGFAIALADGMARHAGGEVASRLAVDSLMASLPPDVLNLDEEPQLEALVKGLEAAHQAIADRVELEPSLTGMGTTAVTVLLGPERVAYQYIGDSRLYWIRNGAVLRVTRDHSIVQVLVDLGTITSDEMETHPLAGKLTSFLGGNNQWGSVQISPGASESASFVPEPGDVVLICSDGIYVELADERLAELACAAGSAEVRVGRIISAVLETAAKDNATLALAVIKAPE
jgi:protein phosphatase